MAKSVFKSRRAPTAIAAAVSDETAPTEGRNVIRVERAPGTDSAVRVWLTPGFRVRSMDNVAFGMNLEDEAGLIDCTTCIPEKDYMTVTAARPIGADAVFHYAWRAQPPVFAARDCCGLPLPACYNVPVEDAPKA